jgi:hypothetical protein
VIRFQFQPASPFGIDWSNPNEVRDYQLSNNKAIQDAFAEIQRVGNNPNFIVVNGQTLQQTLSGALAWPGELKLMTGSLSNARKWARKYGWHLADGTDGYLDARHLFLRGAGTGKDAGATGGSDTHVHTLCMDGHTHTFTGDGHVHAYSVSGTTGASNQVGCCYISCASGTPVADASHTHPYSESGNVDSCNASGTTDATQDGGTAIVGSSLPAYYEVIVLVKMKGKI